MLEIRPNCEYCGRALAPNSTEAWICSYECTYCTSCVESLDNVCPNCGGGFVPRPIRPHGEYRPGVGLGHQPASDKQVTLKRSREEIEELSARLRDVPPEER